MENNNRIVRVVINVLFVTKVLDGGVCTIRTNIDKLSTNIYGILQLFGPLVYVTYIRNKQL